MMRYRSILLRCFLLLLLLSLGCSKNLADPLGPLAKKFDKYPEYSIVLHDMDTSGVFFKSYHHIYKLILGEQQEGEQQEGEQQEGEQQEGEKTLVFRSVLSPWTEVSREFFKKHEPLLGMVLLSKGDDGQVSQDNYPPGYQYIGNPRYGRWKSDSSGGSFWEFYGKYALFSTVLGMGTRPIHRWDYDRYVDYRGRRAPYFGPSGNYYGTRGTHTKKSNPTFYQRQQARQSSRKSSFADKTRSRTGSSYSSRSRSRSSRSGK